METGTESFSLRSAVFGFITLLITILIIMVIIEQTGGIDKLHETVKHAGPWAPVGYVALKALTMVIAPLSGTPIKIAAGTLFGLRDGTLYVVLGDIIGGSINFWLSRLLGRSIIVRLFGEKGLVRVDDLTHKLGEWRALLFAQVFLHAIYDFVSYAAGLTALPFYQYFLVTAIGGFVWSVLLVAFGVSLTEGLTITVLVSSALLVLYLITIFLRRRRRI